MAHEPNPRNLICVMVGLLLLAAVVLWTAIPVVHGQSPTPLARSQQPVMRMAPLPETEWTDVHRELVKTHWRDGPVGNAFRTLLNYPQLVTDTMPFENYIVRQTTLPLRDLELLILRTAWLCRSNYEWARHAGVARKAGISNDELTRIARGPDDRGWSPFDAALLRAADELHVSSFVSERTWNALKARFNTQQLMDAVFAVAEFTMLAGVVNSLGVQVEEGVTDRLPMDVPFSVATVKSNERLIGKKARIDPIDPSEWTPEVRALLDPNGTGRSVAGIYRTYAHHPKMDVPRTLVSEHIRQRSSLPARTRELLIMRIGVLCLSEYEWAAHAPAGRRAGMTEADVQRIIVGPDAGGDPVDVALLSAVDELYRNDVITDATWSRLSSRLDSKQMLDLLITIGGYRMVSMALNTFGVQLEPNAERFPESVPR